MKRFAPLFFVLALAATPGFSPALAADNTLDPYADALVQGGVSQFLNPESLLGPPDRLYTQTGVQGSYLTVDLGMGEEGLGDLTLYYAALSGQGHLTFDFYSAGFDLLHTSSNFVPLDNIWTISYPADTPYRYVRVTNSGSGAVRIDALASAATVSGVPVDDLPFPTDNQPLPDDVEIIDAHPLRGSLIKLADDWNDDTTADTIIYMLDADNHRHIIPNETVFNSWGLSFNDITIVGEGTLTGMPLGKNVYIRPGSYLVKIQQRPEVYAVEAGGVLRWIHNEELAEQLYGTDWSKRVVDVPETLFSQYEFGGALTETQYPAGTFVKTEEGSTWYIDQDRLRWSIGPLTLEALELSEGFLTTGMKASTIASLHEYAGRLIYQDAQRWPF